jgi:hypothetical protein
MTARVHDLHPCVAQRSRYHTRPTVMTIHPYLCNEDSVRLHRQRTLLGFGICNAVQSFPPSWYAP